MISHFYFVSLTKLNPQTQIYIMKTFLKIAVLSAVLLVFAGLMVSCNDQPECRCEELMNQPAKMCAFSTFICGLEILLEGDFDTPSSWTFCQEGDSLIFIGRSPFLLGEDGLFFIKGEVLDTVEHGLRVRLIDDLKGSFPQNINTFTVWGVGRYSYFFTSDNRSDWLTIDWKVGDTLLMLLTSVNRDRVETTLNMCCIPEETRSRWFERPGDFRTFDCLPSVAKLSENYVSARWLSWDWDEKRMITEMPRKEFDELLLRLQLLNSRP